MNRDVSEPESPRGGGMLSEMRPLTSVTAQQPVGKALMKQPDYQTPGTPGPPPTSQRTLLLSAS